MADIISGAEVIQDARRYLGIPYVFGGGPNNPRAGLDCSGLVQRVAFDLGFSSCPRTSESQFSWAARTQSPGTGSLIFFVGAPEEAGSPGHVAFYIAHGVMLDAPHSGTSVSIQHYDPNGVGENRVVGYGNFPRVKPSTSANASVNPVQEAAGSAAAGAASIGAVVGVLVVGLLIAGIVVLGFMLA